MAKVLKEYFRDVQSSDAYEYGYGIKRDFLTHPFETNSVDWIITNPPFRLCEEFVLRALNIARYGVAILARTVFLESIGRYGRIFRDYPLHKLSLNRVYSRHAQNPKQTAQAQIEAASL
jgi:hypothetical protein